MASADFSFVQRQMLLLLKEIYSHSFIDFSRELPSSVYFERDMSGYAVLLILTFHSIYIRKCFRSTVHYVEMVLTKEVVAHLVMRHLGISYSEADTLCTEDEVESGSWKKKGIRFFCRNLMVLGRPKLIPCFH